jgi:hypothetical protein
MKLCFSSLCYNFYMNKTLSVIAAILGIGFLWLTFIYWTTPASGLPTFLPGYDAAMSGVHIKHGLLALILALCLFVFAWFQTGKKAK